MFNNNNNNLDIYLPDSFTWAVQSVEVSLIVILFLLLYIVFNRCLIVLAMIKCNIILLPIYLNL